MVIDFNYVVFWLNLG